MSASPQEDLPGVPNASADGQIGALALMIFGVWTTETGKESMARLQQSVPPCFQGAVLQVLLAPATKHITPLAHAILGDQKIMEHQAGL